MPHEQSKRARTPLSRDRRYSALMTMLRRSREFETAYREWRCSSMIDVATPTERRTFENPEALALDVAEWLCALAQASDRKFAVCLSGGSTPRHLYECLAAPVVASRFPWNRVHWFWADERFVPHDDPDSNYRIADYVLLSRVPIDRRNVHAIPTTNLSPEQAAAAYEATLKGFYGASELEPR